jgi:hypothetical protein
MSWVSCGRCHHPFDFFFVLGSTGLGPDAVLCRLCRTPIETGRQEWRDFGAARRWRYALRSIVYALLVATAFGHVGFTSYYALWDFRKHAATAFLHSPPFLALTVASGVAVLALQAWRIRRSERRARENRPRFPGPWGLDLDFGLQLKAALLLGVSFFVFSSLGAWLRSDPARGRRVRQGVAAVAPASAPNGVAPTTVMAPATAMAPATGRMRRAISEVVKDPMRLRETLASPS